MWRLRQILLLLKGHCFSLILGATLQKTNGPRKVKNFPNVMEMQEGQESPEQISMLLHAWLILPWNILVPKS